MTAAHSMSARAKARKRALDVLYAAEMRDVDPLTVLTERETVADLTPMGPYAEQLVRGYVAHATRVDDLIAQHLEGWTLDRIPPVDRSILRIATYELVYGSDIPPAVAVDQAVELAKTLSTDASSRFVNGVLGQIVVIAPQLRAPQ